MQLFKQARSSFPLNLFMTLMIYFICCGCRIICLCRINYLSCSDFSGRVWLRGWSSGHPSITAAIVIIWIMTSNRISDSYRYSLESNDIWLLEGRSYWFNWDRHPFILFPKLFLSDYFYIQENPACIDRWSDPISNVSFTWIWEYSRAAE